MADFKERFERWKNGESYWDIIGKPLGEHRRTKQFSDEEKAELDRYIDNLPEYSNGKSNAGYYDYMEALSANKAEEWSKDLGYALDPDQVLMDMLNDNTYNYKAMYDKYGADDTTHEGHFSDEFKTAYHPTFSIESMYSGIPSEYNPQGIAGGIWGQSGHGLVPGEYYLNDRFGSVGYNYWNTQMYLDNAENVPYVQKFGIPTNFNSGKSGINIKKAKRGTFTAAATKAGMGVQAFANKVLSAPKGKYSSAMRKKANFARNASKWN